MLLSFSDGTLSHRLQVEVNSGALSFGWQEGGGFEIDLQWKDGKPTQATVRSLAGSQLRFRTDSELDVKCGEKAAKIEKDESGCAFLQTQEGATYDILFR